MTKILVTGSTGLTGRQVVKDLVEKNFHVYSCFNVEKPEFGIPTHLDISKKDKIVSTLQTIKPDLVIHLAAITDVDLCEIQKELAILINTKSTEILARESTKQDAFFVYMSTDYVFDGKEGMRNESDIPNPLNFYGKSKLDGEIALNNLASSYAIVRTSTPFGLHPKKKSFPLWVKENLESKREIPVIIDQYTSPTFVPNLSKLLIEVATREITGIIHLAGASRLSRYEFATVIADKLNLDKTLLKPTKIDQMKWKARRPHDSSLDVSKANKILHNKPQKIEQSLELFINQIKNTS
jgi:dTDP-4-dehydrorhamnose reductase